MNTLQKLSTDYSRIEQAIRYIDANLLSQPDLKEVAAHLGLSEYHFQRLFTRWAGISSKRFLQFLTREYAKDLLDRSADLLEVTYAAGLSSPGRLHDLFVHTEAVTPAEYRSGAAGLEITYGFHPTPFGECLLALTERGLCFLSFVDGSHASTLEALCSTWPNAALIESPAITLQVVEQVFSGLPAAPLALHLRGTNFQLKVWEALLRLPPGCWTSYQALAEKLGTPASARAVGNALARNPVAFLIPCHRVLQKTGHFGNYRYGPIRKQAILAWEQAHAVPA